MATEPVPQLLELIGNRRTVPEAVAEIRLRECVAELQGELGILRKRTSRPKMQQKDRIRKLTAIVNEAGRLAMLLRTNSVGSYLTTPRLWPQFCGLESVLDDLASVASRAQRLIDDPETLHFVLTVEGDESYEASETDEAYLIYGAAIFTWHEITGRYPAKGASGPFARFVECIQQTVAPELPFSETALKSAVTRRRKKLDAKPARNARSVS